jgi:hypothetical protein
MPRLLRASSLAAWWRPEQEERFQRKWKKIIAADFISDKSLEVILGVKVFSCDK